MKSTSRGKKQLSDDHTSSSGNHSRKGNIGNTALCASRVRRGKGEVPSRSVEASGEGETTIHVLDNGVDRTPLPLQATAKGKSGPHGAGNVMSSIVSGSIAQTGAGDSASVFQSFAINNSTEMGLGTSSADAPSQSQVGFLTNSSSLTSISVDHRASLTSGSTRGGGGKHSSTNHLSLLRDECQVCEMPQPYSRELRRQWLDAKTTVVLTETPTIMLYTHQDEIVPNDQPALLEKVVQRNETYAKLVEAKRVDEGTRFQVKGVWTFVPPKKSIHCAIQPPRKKDAGPFQVTPWMLRDEFSALTQQDTTAELHDGVGDEDEENEEVELVETNSDNGRDNSSERNTDPSATGATQQCTSWMFSDTIMSTLRIMERAVVQNTMEELQLSYRGITMDPGAHRTKQLDAPANNKELNEEEEVAAGNAWGGAVASSAGAAGGDGQGQQTGLSAPSQDLVPASNADSDKAEVPLLRLSEDIKSLWTFRAPMTKNRSVTCMAWNCRESDILAVGYSAVRQEDGHHLDLSGNYTGGVVCCWSLKNPLAPERVIYLASEAGVSSIAFSYEHPSLLAVGNTEGIIVIYDIQKDSNIPAIRTAVTSGQHTGAVWELKWVARHKERGEFLLSISGDGRVVQWAVGKTIERVAPDLMTLKRQHGTAGESPFAQDSRALSRNGSNNNNNKRGTNGVLQPQQPQRRKCDALFSRQCGGMCFDVHPADSTMYIVGTEDGSIHQCSKSQTENYELDYAAHSELVYRIRWSPYSDNYFLTCSADWSSRLYRLGKSAQLLTFDSPNQDAVQDVAWAYTSSTHFAAVTAQGSVEFWSIADPIHPCSRAQYLDGRRLANILFAEQEAAVVVVGDEKGDVTVFRLLSKQYSGMNLSVEEQEQELEEVIRKATT
ncbi:hypothetical protein ERJ75_000381000 [Trypanosoma vivax]|uniref:Dynein axonemal intermediate chain 4 n=1 Tax=Trypanosoma vivax (strain Y486) TaxID=1055687 RepID=G0TRW8_TRYVY|nr:putative dynein intermediate chain [Trypanosoma vivax]KAH8617424.1 hypothetical protein ERJ75_000381000 [Trypanosoma vivax]CCC46691.1 putative dynein intermediate chain [Trypanosoma vivax Y486]